MLRRTWNGISLFLDPDCVKSADFHLYTDAASTVGFGGVFRNQWLASSWPKDIPQVADSEHSMAYLRVIPHCGGGCIVGQMLDKETYSVHV